MALKKLTWIGSLALLCFFLPSLGYKIWDFIVYAPWPVKSWLMYLVMAVIMINLIRWRLRRRKNHLETAPAQAEKDEAKPMIIAKERLARGEITLEEFRAIRQELCRDDS